MKTEKHEIIHRIDKLVTCPACKGTGATQGLDGISPCWKCKGTGKVTMKVTKTEYM